MGRAAPIAGISITCVFMLVFMIVWLSAAINIPLFPLNLIFCIIGIVVPLMVIRSSINGVRKGREMMERKEKEGAGAGEETEEKPDSGDYSGYCPYCGSPVNPDYGFCRVCGKKIRWSPWIAEPFA